MSIIKPLYQNIFVAGQLQAGDFSELATQGIKIIINNRPDGEELGQLSHETALTLAADNGMEYHYLPMANGQPMPSNLIADFKAIVDATDTPILAHCRSGMRSSFIWALGQVGAGNISVDDAITAAKGAGIPLDSVRNVLEQHA